MATMDDVRGLFSSCLPLSRFRSNKDGDGNSNNNDPIVHPRKSGTVKRASNISSQPLSIRGRDATGCVIPQQGLDETGPQPLSATWRIELVWDGKETQPRRWAGFADDNDMWLHSGNCLVYFEEPNMRFPATPHFRLDATVLTDTGLPFLLALVQAGKVMPTERVNGRQPHMLPLPRPQSPDYLPMVKSFSPLRFPELERSGRDGNRQRAVEERRTWAANENRWSLYLDCQQASNDPRDDSVKITHELWFVLPSHFDAEDKHRRKLAIRNALSILHGGSIVGHDFVLALGDAQETLVTFGKKSPESDVWRDTNELLAKYLVSKQLHDVRNNLQHALNVLAWSEKPTVQWELGYLESFVHVCGMLDVETLEMDEFKQLSLSTRTNLLNSHNGLHVVMQEVEKRLESFDLSEMWVGHKHASSFAKKAFEGFRVFLVEFYTKIYGTWPPPSSDGVEYWLNRKVVKHLQIDFGRLYDFIVDKHIYWNNLRAAYRRDWEMVCTDVTRQFVADLANINVTDILVAFDDCHGAAHIPLPYPLMPANDVSPLKEKTPSILSSLRKREGEVDQERLKIDILMSYSRAASHERLGFSRDDVALPISFSEHEQHFPGNGTCQEGRIGRWILLYGLLQMLSCLSVDVEGLQFTEGVTYPLCASLSGSPPWLSGRPATTMQEATPLRSHCFTAPDRLYGPRILPPNWLNRLSQMSRRSARTSSLWRNDRQSVVKEESPERGAERETPSIVEREISAKAEGGSSAHAGRETSAHAERETSSSARDKDRPGNYSFENSPLAYKRPLSSTSTDTVQLDDFPNPLGSHPVHRSLESAIEQSRTNARYAERLAHLRRQTAVLDGYIRAASPLQASPRTSRQLRDERVRSTATGDSQWTDAGTTSITPTIREADTVDLPLRRGRLTDVTRRN